MADRRITELSAVSAINVEIDLLPIVSEGTTKKITAKSFAENIEFLSYQGTDLKALSANWQNTYTTVEQTSSIWQDTNTTVVANSANWESTYSTVKETSANWESTYSTVRDTSANWDNGYTTVTQNSGNWESTYSSVKETSAVWQDTTTVVQTNSAIWGTVEFNGDVTYADVLSGLNEMLRFTVGGVTRYIRLFDIGAELFLFGTEDTSDNIITEDNNFQILFD